jgi:hypothetical protein
MGENILDDLVALFPTIDQGRPNSNPYTFVPSESIELGFEANLAIELCHRIQ